MELQKKEKDGYVFHCLTCKYWDDTQEGMDFYCRKLDHYIKEGHAMLFHAKRCGENPIEGETNG